MLSGETALKITIIIIINAVFNAVCLYNAYLFLSLTYANAICFHALSLGY